MTDHDDLPPELTARYKAKHSGQMFYVIGKGEQREVIPCSQLSGWRHNGKYWRIHFIAFPRRRR